MTEDLYSVPFASWLCRVQAALAEEQPAEVPCGDCNACCRTLHVVHVRPDERRTRARIPRRFLLPAPGLPPGNLVLGYEKAGCCPLLIGGHCSIYEDRPLACRTYDCRIYAAAASPRIGLRSPARSSAGGSPIRCRTTAIAMPR